MHNRTILQSFAEAGEDALNFAISKFVQIVATVVFFALMTRGRKTWIFVFHLFAFFEGIVSLTIPERYLGDWATGPLDESHCVLGRCAGLLLICWVLGYFFTYKSTDATVEASVLLGSLVVMMCNLLCVGYLMTHPPSEEEKVRIEPETVSRMFYVTLLFTIGTVYHWIRMGDFGGYSEVSSSANIHLRVHFVIIFLMGVMNFAFPENSFKMIFNLSEPDSVHILYMRLAGSLYIAMAMLSAKAANFLRDSDKDAVVVSQWMYYVTLFPYSWYLYEVWWDHMGWTNILAKLLHDSIVVLNTTAAFNQNVVSVFQNIVLPSFKAVPNDIRVSLKYKRI